MPFFAAIFADEIEVAPIGIGFGEELRWASEELPIQELVLNEAVDRFNITLPGVAFGRDEAVIGSEQAHRGGQAALQFILLKLAAVVGLPDKL